MKAITASRKMKMKAITAKYIESESGTSARGDVWDKKKVCGANPPGDAAKQSGSHP